MTASRIQIARVPTDALHNALLHCRYDLPLTSHTFARSMQLIWWTNQ